MNTPKYSRTGQRATRSRRAIGFRRAPYDGVDEDISNAPTSPAGSWTLLRRCTDVRRPAERLRPPSDELRPRGQQRRPARRTPCRAGSTGRANRRSGRHDRARRGITTPSEARRLRPARRGRAVTAFQPTSRTTRRGGATRSSADGAQARHARLRRGTREPRTAARLTLEHSCDLRRSIAAMKPSWSYQEPAPLPPLTAEPLSLPPGRSSPATRSRSCTLRETSSRNYAGRRPVLGPTPTKEHRCPTTPPRPAVFDAC